MTEWDISADAHVEMLRTDCLQDLKILEQRKPDIAVHPIYLELRLIQFRLYLAFWFRKVELSL